MAYKKFLFAFFLINFVVLVMGRLIIDDGTGNYTFSTTTPSAISEEDDMGARTFGVPCPLGTILRKNSFSKRKRCLKGI